MRWRLENSPHKVWAFLQRDASIRACHRAIAVQKESIRVSDVSRQSVSVASAVRAGRRSAAGDRCAVAGTRRRTGFPDAAGRDRFGQDVHDGERHCARRLPNIGACAEQDAGGAAVLRNARVLPEQRGRVLRLVLRLLPAGSLRPVARPLYREGLVDQRAHRADAPVGDQVPARAARCGDRGHGVGDLRHRRPVGLSLDGADAAPQGPLQPARHHRAADADAVQAQRDWTSRAALSAFAATRSTSSRPSTPSWPCGSNSSTTRSTRSSCSTR